MSEHEIKHKQMKFYKDSKAGCAFAAIAAKKPEKYGWYQFVLEPNSKTIESVIKSTISAPNVTMASLIFPDVKRPNQLVEFTKELENCESIFLEQDVIFDDNHCLGFRVRVGTLASWVSGFGNFEFLPKTRQTPYTEIAFRVKPRPAYEWNMKDPIEGVIHLADLDMLGITRATFETLWNLSLEQTKKLLGHKPDMKSAAKTTYNLPIDLSGYHG